jgi:hypothetical protein
MVVVAVVLPRAALLVTLRRLPMVLVLSRTLALVALASRRFGLALPHDLLVAPRLVYLVEETHVDVACAR